jgi:uncharacterized protein YcbK (DUF882 family)
LHVRVWTAHKFRPDSFSYCAARRVGLAVIVLASGTQGLQPAEANGDTRTISLHHVHSKEDLTITFRKNGRYDDGALKKINWLLRDWRKDQEIKMDPQVIDLLWEIHQEVGAKESIHVIGGYRSPGTNAMLRRRSKGVAKASLHTQGKAVDFFIPGVPLEAIRAAGLRLHGGGVGFYPTSGSPFVHMDVGGIRHWPRMTREQLVKVFPDGRTVHVPTDGNPLPGHQLALADIERGANRTVAPQQKRSLIASLFGRAQDSEETEDKAAQRQAPEPAAKPPASAKPTPTVTAMATAPKPAAAPAKTEAAVPLPPVRPTFQIASAEIRPAPAPVLRPPAPIPSAPTPNDIISSRGYWQGLPDNTPAAPVRVAEAAPDNLSSVRRLLSRSVTSPAGPETTASVGPFARPDRVPPELALAYAAQFGNQVAPPQLPSARPVPVVVQSKATPARVTTQGATSVAVKPAETTGHSQPAAVAAAERLNNPWLRGVVMASSVQNALTVTVVGEQDFSALVQYMRKPASAVMMTFSHDPHLGMTTEGFTGSAVVFQATVTFDDRRHHATFEDRRTTALR